MTKTILLHNDPAILQNLQSDLHESFWEISLYKSMELLSHQMRYQLGLPYVGGRSDAMISFQEDTSGQPVDDGGPVVEEAKTLVNELADEILKGKLEALDSEKELLAEELATEMSELNPMDDDEDEDERGGDDEDRDSQDDDNDGDSDDTTDDSGVSEDTHVEAIIECGELALDTLDTLVEGFLNNNTPEHLNVLAHIDFSKYSGYQLCSFDEAGLVTLKLKE